MSNKSEMVLLDDRQSVAVDTVKGDRNDSRSSSADSVPIELDWFRSTCHVLLVTAGVPLNLIIACVIMAFRRLHNKPRIILWLGVTYCNLLTLFTILVELLAYHMENRSVCLIFVSITGIAYTCLLFTLFLALLDRYVAIVHPLWHREKITVQRVIIGQIFGFFSLVLIIKFPFIVQLIPLNCDMSMVHGKIIAVTNMVLLLMCLVAQIVVYHKTRQYFPRKKDGNEASVSFVQIANRHRQDLPMYSTNISPSELPHQGHQIAKELTIVATSSSSGCDRPPVDQAASSGYLMKRHGGNRRMEVEATWSLLAGVFSLLLFTFPTLLMGFIEWGCRLVYDEEQCSTIGVMTFRARELLLGHLVYNPVMYMIRSREFTSTVREKFFLNNRQTNARYQGR